MRRKLLRLNLRLIFSSLIFILFFSTLFFFVLFLAYTMWSPFIQPINFSVIIGMLEYLEVGIFVMAFCHAMYCSHQAYTLEQICFIPHSLVVSCKLGAVMIASSAVCLIPTVYIIVSAVQQGTDLLFTLNTLCYTLIRWTALLLVADTSGFLIGRGIRSTYSYILAIPFSFLTSFFNRTAVEFICGSHPFASRVVAQLLSVGDNYVGAAEMDYPGSRLDLHFLFDSFFSVLLALLLFLLVHLTASKRLTARKIISCAVPACAIVLTAAAVVMSAPQEYQYDKKLYVAPKDIQPYEITAYAGSLTLSESSAFSGSFTVQPTGSATPDFLTFRLDNCFTVDELSSNGRQIAYTQSGDYITVAAPTEQTTYNIRYHGRVYYISDIGCVNLFTSWLSAALPPNFAFVPLLDGDSSLKHYDIHVASLNTVISNLNVTSEKGLYRLSGDASSICIFSGFLSKYDYEGATVYRAKYNFSTDYNAVLSDAFICGEYIDPYTFTPVKGSLAWPHKAFLIYDLYGVLGFPVVYGDYILLNYGFTS